MRVSPLLVFQRGFLRGILSLHFRVIYLFEKLVLFLHFCIAKKNFFFNKPTLYKISPSPHILYFFQEFEVI